MQPQVDESGVGEAGYLDNASSHLVNCCGPVSCTCSFSLSVPVKFVCYIIKTGILVGLAQIGARFSKPRSIGQSMRAPQSCSLLLAMIVPVRHPCKLA